MRTSDYSRHCCCDPLRPGRLLAVAAILVLGAKTAAAAVAVRKEGPFSLRSVSGLVHQGVLDRLSGTTAAKTATINRGRNHSRPRKAEEHVATGSTPSSLHRTSTTTRTTKRRSSPNRHPRSPPASTLSKAFRTRGGAKVAPPPPQSTNPGGEGGGKGSTVPSSHGSVLGPITRRHAAAGGDAQQGTGEGGQGQQEFAPQFIDFNSRVGFMKKVYLTVSVQLVYTGMVCALMRGYREPILGLLFGHGSIPQIMFFIGTIATIVGTNATLWANVELRQSFPRNLPLLTAFTTAWALYVGVFSLMFTKGSVIRAVFQAAFVVGSLTAYAFRTNPKHELTQLGAGLYSAGNALGMFCLMKLFFFRGHRTSDLALSCLATLFFSLYLVYDTYRIIGGKHRQSGMFGVKDWAVAAMALYEDIMQIFIHLLAIFGEAQR